MTYDQNYYNLRKQELQQESLKNVVEAYQDIERSVFKVVNKARELQTKLQELETKEKANQEATKKTTRKSPNPLNQ